MGKAQEGAEREDVALTAEADDLAHGDGRDDGVAAELFPRVDVAEVDLDDRQADASRREIE